VADTQVDFYLLGAADPRARDGTNTPGRERESR
jgi:hypothetical protein